MSSMNTLGLWRHFHWRLCFLKAHIDYFWPHPFDWMRSVQGPRRLPIESPYSLFRWDETSGSRSPRVPCFEGPELLPRVCAGIFHETNFKVDYGPKGWQLFLWSVDKSSGPSQCESELRLEREGELLIGWGLILLKPQYLGTKLCVCLF